MYVVLSFLKSTGSLVFGTDNHILSLSHLASWLC